MTSATVSTTTDGTVVSITVRGEIDIDNAAGIEERILGAIDNHATSVRVDLTDLRYMDSSGLRILFTLAARLEVLQIRLDIIAPDGSPTRRVLDLAGFRAI
jgi:anti-anti-sigma factor